MNEFVATSRKLRQREAAGTLDHEALGGLLRRRLRAQDSAEALVVTVRAIEAAALMHLWAVEVDMAILVNAAERNPRPGRLHAEHHTALDVYVPTRITAVAALLMCEIDPTSISGLALETISSDGARLTLVDDTIEIPPLLRPYLEAHTLYRRICGAADTDTLLVNERGEVPKLSWFGRLAKLIELEAGVRLSRTRTDRKALTTFEWLAAHGIEVRHIQNTGIPRRARS